MKRFSLNTLWLLFGITFLLGLGTYLGLSLLLMQIAETRFDLWGRLTLGVLALAGFFFLFLRHIYRFGDFLEKRGRDEARERFRDIYRVIALPTEDLRNIWQIQNIEVGDYGWEAKPLFNNGLIYLQGLTDEWGWVWRAGFRRDQIELVGPKPVSQYDWKDFEFEGPKPKACYHWQYGKPCQPCPFPVQTKGKHARLHFPT